MKDSFDVIIIGGGLAGLTAAYTCQAYGFNPLIIEKSNCLGGGNRSYIDTVGNIFDYGYHALDAGRSQITTSFFMKVLDGNFRRFSLRRGIVIRNHLIEYNAALKNWPADLQVLFNKNAFTDNIADKITLKDLEQIYSEEFIDLILKDVLPSYPSKKWSLENGGNVGDHIGYVYPWFFPKAEKTKLRTQEWDSYHDKMRTQEAQVLYPTQGGFEGFVKGIEMQVRSNPHLLLLNAQNIQLNRKLQNSNKVDSVTVNGKNYIAPLILWCAPLPQLLSILNSPLKMPGPRQELVLGNFVFSKTITSDYHEILVGSAGHHINRISFPGLIAGKNNNLLQVEFYYPENAFKLTQEEWRLDWLRSLTELGLIDEKNQVENFSFISQFKGFTSAESFDLISNKMKDQLTSLNTNIVVPFPMAGPENINRLVPETIQSTVQALSKLRL